MLHSESFTITTHGRATHEITAKVQRVVAASDVADGLCAVFLHHTSASLLFCEYADADVRRDMETLLARLCPDGDPAFVHTCEGPDDMAAHARTALTQSSVTIPIRGGRCDLGTWQGLFVWEHRTAPHRRRLTVTVIGG